MSILNYHHITMLLYTSGGSIPSPSPPHPLHPYSRHFCLEISVGIPFTFRAKLNAPGDEDDQKAGGQTESSVWWDKLLSVQYTTAADLDRWWQATHRILSCQTLRSRTYRGRNDLLDEAVFQSLEYFQCTVLEAVRLSIKTINHNLFKYNP